MSKQYLTTHTIDNAHPTDIFSIAATSKQILSASGSSSLRIYNTTDLSYPLVQTIENAHPLGCHHLVASKNGNVAASAGFGGEVKIWRYESDQWLQERMIVDGNTAGAIWAIALSDEGSVLAATSFDGRINLWDNSADGKRFEEYETKGSFGMSIDLSADGKYTASGHEDGGVYIFNNQSGRLKYSLLGLVKPVRAVMFSPGVSLIAAAGDSRFIALYDVDSGEQVAQLAGHVSWTFSLDWSQTGEFLLSCSYDGRVKVWSIDRRECVATHSETDKTLWSVRWLPKLGQSEGFATAGASRSICFYKEATGS